MSKLTVRSWGLVFAAVLAVLLGCSSKLADTRSALQHFKDEQATTVTPHGRIMTETVEEIDGKLQYQTEDGKHWQVGYSKRADGTYEYHTPDEMK